MLSSPRWIEEGSMTRTFRLRVRQLLFAGTVAVLLVAGTAGWPRH